MQFEYRYQSPSPTPFKLLNTSSATSQLSLMTRLTASLLIPPLPPSRVLTPTTFFPQIETARTTSPTANSSLVGSKNIFSPTLTTSRVIGGGILSAGYKGRPLSQSSSKTGSSAASETNFGKKVLRRARYVVSVRRVAGCDNGGVNSNIYPFRSSHQHIASQEQAGPGQEEGRKEQTSTKIFQ